MDSKVNYTIVGMFVVVLGAAFIMMFFWLSATRHDKVYHTYVSYVHEDVTGLSVQTPVRYNGVQVGYVSKVKLDPRNPQLVKLILKIEEGTPITTSTVVTLLPMGITGVIYVGLKALTPKAPLLGAKPGQKYPVIPSEPSFLMQLGKVLPELTGNLKNISTSITKLLNEKNRKAIDSTLQNVSVLTKNLADNSKRLDDISKSLQETLNNTAIVSKKLPNLVDELNTTLKNIQQTSIQIRGVSSSAQLVMKDGRVTIQNLNNQLLPSVQQMMVKLNGIMSNLNQVTAEMERNPSMFIRGRTPGQPGPGEK